NGLGASVNPVVFTIPTIINGATTCVPGTGSPVNPTSITDGATATFGFECTGLGAVGDRFKATLSFVYTQSGQTLSHTVIGDMTARIE
ncbi:MAG: hypothetical protein AABX90_00910, partial [Nanoarchaeota archaeon]